MAALRRSLSSTVGADSAAHALRSAGNVAGDAFFRLLTHVPGAQPSDGSAERADLSEDVFWRRLSQLFEVRGWGRLTNERVHPGVAALDAHDWVESDPDTAAGRPSCHFSTGLLANVLGQAAGDEVAVLEVECRSCGDDRCRFLYGSPAALERLYGDVHAGSDAAAALEALA
jgi:hypothetical protein